MTTFLICDSRISQSGRYLLQVQIVYNDRLKNEEIKSEHSSEF